MNSECLAVAREAVKEAETKLWDIAAMKVIVEEAGGRFTELSGSAVNPATTACIATNGLVHQQIVDRFRR